MKEVTRIRIAKISYDIDLTAKKKLETYINALSEYAEDDNVLEDIEIRITELLEQRGVKSGDVISGDDVDSIRQTLGEPKEFSGDSDIAIGPDEQADGTVKRKLYRDIDGAVVGGVFSGMANYFKINALWFRLAFIVLLFISFGFAAIVYAILWVAIPAAKTVTEKLQMRGDAASLVNIRKYNESQEGLTTTKDRIEMRRRGFGVFVGIAGVLSTLGALTLTIAGTVGWLAASSYAELTEYSWIAFGLAIASGVLLATLSIIVSICGFRARVTKKSVITAVAVIIAGVLTFAGSAGIIGLGVWQKESEIRASITERSVTLPTDFASIKNLTIDARFASVGYVVSQDTRATITSVPGVNAVIKQTGNDATLTLQAARDNASVVYNVSIVIYGPELETITAQTGSTQYSGKTQQLKAVVSNNASLSLTGNFRTLSAELKENANFSAQQASVNAVELSMESNTSANLGNIETLKLQQPSACPNNAKAQVWIESVAASTYNYNGTEIVKTSQNIACGLVEIGSQNDFYNEY